MTRKLLSLLVASAALAGCSGIDSDDRYITAESVTPQRAVLVEDFTGQNCVNCPAAHETIGKTIEKYGEAVIPVSIHAGSFAIEATYTRYTGLMQPEGNTYNDAWGIDEWPKGVVNRTSGPINYQEWENAVRTELAKESPLDIEVSADCPEGASEVSISITLEPQQALDANLQVWILEDGIVARQRDIDRGLITDYVHNHVYRASVNGVGGERVVLQANIHSPYDYTIPLRATDTETWVPANLSVVAFVYTPADGVLQAAKAYVKTE